MHDPDTLFSQLELITETLPESTLKAAVEQRATITPLLLEELRQMAADPASVEALPADYMRHIYAIYLLAQFREHAAFEPLLAFLATPGEVVMDTMEGVVTEDLGRILASICAGDTAPIKALIENPDADEWVRSGTLDTFAILHREGQLTRDEYIAYLQALFTRPIARQYHFLWSGMVIAACDLRAVELLPEIQRAFDDDLVDPGVISLSYAEDLIKRERTNSGEFWLSGSKGFIGPIVEEIGGWACFNREKSSGRASPPPMPEVSQPSALSARPAAVRTGPKVGRNDPCPCGSGKKHKKCCLV
jgi:hypothetical protein